MAAVAAAARTRHALVRSLSSLSSLSSLLSHSSLDAARRSFSARTASGDAPPTTFLREMINSLLPENRNGTSTLPGIIRGPSPRKSVRSSFVPRPSSFVLRRAGVPRSSIGGRPAEGVWQGTEATERSSSLRQLDRRPTLTTTINQRPHHNQPMPSPPTTGRRHRRHGRPRRSRRQRGVQQRRRVLLEHPSDQSPLPESELEHPGYAREVGDIRLAAGAPHPGCH